MSRAPTPELLAELRGADAANSRRASEPPLPLASVPTRDEVELILRHTKGNVSRAAEALGISRDKLRRLLKRYELES